MLTLCYHRVIIVLSSCYHRDIIVLSSCYHVIIMLSSCCQVRLKISTQQGSVLENGVCVSENFLCVCVCERERMLCVRMFCVYVCLCERTVGHLVNQQVDERLRIIDRSRPSSFLSPLFPLSFFKLNYYCGLQD